MTDPLDLDQIRAGAEAADQGDWFYDSEGDIWDGKARGVLIANCDLTENATHIANMDPPTTQRLIARLEQAEEEVAELDSMEQETLKAKARRLEAKLQRAEAALREIRKITCESLEDEDFQPQFSQRNHMTGPALRGAFERISDAVTRAAQESKP